MKAWKKGENMDALWKVYVDNPLKEIRRLQMHY